MKDFAGSSITYYGLARERVLNKYPRLISALMILALISMTGLAIFLISDLVSFASNPDHEGVFVGHDIKGQENAVASMTDSNEKSRNLVVQDSEDKHNNGTGALIGTNSSPTLENLSRQTEEKNFASKSSSSSYSVKKHHSSSSSSSSSTSSSSAKSAKKSNNVNNLTQESNSSKNDTFTNQSMNNSQGNESENANATVGMIPESLPPANSNPTKEASARVPTVTIQFKEDTSSRAKSEQNLISESSNIGRGDASLPNTDSTPVSDAATSKSGSQESGPAADNSNIAQSSTDSEKNTDSQAIGKQSSSSQKSNAAVSSQTQKAQKIRAKQIANKNRVVENMKKKTAKSRAKTASN